MKASSTLFVGLLLAQLQAAWAVSTFITEEAHIQDEGQVELEIFPEVSRSGDETNYGLLSIAGYSFTHDFELIVGAGKKFYPKHDQSKWVSTLIMPKILLVESRDDHYLFTPHIAVMGGVGSWDSSHHAQFFMVANSWTTWEEHLHIHLNYGWREGDDGHKHFSAPYWAINFELGITSPDYRFIAEAFNGLPFDSQAAPLIYQIGARWLVAQDHQWDLCLGTGEETEGFHKGTGHHEYWVQVGWRKIFDL